ncbi:MAG: hypothetical protein HOZ81_53815 [Streptomyces sp.]|nr:hypothetical protein [Streptomyces sp.]NUP39224.1 hypothetical protein [Streptomyces sp.]
MRPRVKSVAWDRDGEQLRVVYDSRDQLQLQDPDGAVEALLQLLVEGGRTTSELAAATNAQEEDIRAAVSVLDDYGLLEDGDRAGQFDADGLERYFSNLGFFESFASVARGREDFQRTLREAHVLVLGTGGVSSNTIQHLCGLGVGRLTLLDRDKVEPRNFARQYLYRWDDIGHSKVHRAVEWVGGFDPAIKVEGVETEIVTCRQMEELLGEVAPDVVMSGVDSPDEIDSWINQACVSRGIPYVRAGMRVTEGRVWSVDPRRSACLACADDLGDPLSPEERAAFDLFGRIPRVNRAIGPVVGLLGSLSAFEILRYLTRFEPPAYAGGTLTIDFAAACAIRVAARPRNPACAVCGDDTPMRGGEAK